MIFFLIIYNIFTQILGLFNNKKTFLISTLIIIIFKLIMTIPCINSFYMMGYNQVYGEIFSTTISYILGIIFIMITLNKKYQINSNFFENYFEEDKINMVYREIVLVKDYFNYIKENNESQIKNSKIIFFNDINQNPAF